MENRTPASIVCKLLGVRALARALGITPGAVSRWQTRGWVPSKHHARILDIARLRRKRLTDRMLTRGT